MADTPKLPVNEILSDLRAFLDAHGELSGPRIARLKWKHISSSSWGRFVQTARNEWREAQHLREHGLPASSVPGESGTTPAPTDAEPANPGNGLINWSQQIGALLKQADLLARQSVFVDPTTNVERVRNPMVLRQSMAARTAALRLAGDREDSVFSAERIAYWEGEFGEAIGEALGKVRNEDQRVLATRIINACNEVIKRREAERRFVVSGDALAAAANIKKENQK